MLNLPFFSVLERAENILLAGAGGGYDVFSGLPLYFGLRAVGKTVHLANLSFSFLPPLGKGRLTPSLHQITADSAAFTDYFPEKHLSQWFRVHRGTEVPVYCFERTGVGPLLAGYRVLVERLALDTVILVDGGTDSLMRGDEAGLGTPHEDIASIAAVDELEVEHKMLACLGFGIDAFHGVCHAHFMEGVAQLIRSGGYLGTFSLTEEMPEVQAYRAATEYVFSKMPDQISIVSSSILSALAGHYGDYHATSRTRGSELWINPLMSLYWCFRLPQVAERILYLEAVKETHEYADVRQVIREYRSRCETIRLRETIPV